MRLIELANKVLNGEELTYAEGVEIINTSDEDTMLLIALADKIRQKYHGDAVDLCSIVNARSGRCPENCSFCAQSAFHKTGIAEHELLKEVMRDDVYQKTIKSIERPLELARYKRENTKLRNQLNIIREERDNAISELKKYKK